MFRLRRTASVYRQRSRTVIRSRWLLRALYRRVAAEISETHMIFCGRPLSRRDSAASPNRLRLLGGLDLSGTPDVLRGLRRAPKRTCEPEIRSRRYNSLCWAHCPILMAYDS